VLVLRSNPVPELALITLSWENPVSQLWYVSILSRVSIPEL
jgi:hypothetical protein